VIIRALVHLALHYEELYDEGGRGWRREQRATRTLNKHDREGPSHADKLRGVQAQIDTSVSPPPAHSGIEECL